MFDLWEFCTRNWQVNFPPEVSKAASPLHFGILGAANIAATALITPAKSHSEVVVQAVAARNKTRAEAYAKKHGIPQVYDSYEALLDDPSIDAVYIPLPAALHYEWALRSIAKGKHVLLEKPAVVNAAEAEKLFLSPLLKQPNAPILLEAFHFRFQPAWKGFLDLVDRSRIEHVAAVARLPKFMIPRDGIKFDYDLGGGNMLDLGTYNMYALRDIMGAEPMQCTSCTVRTPPAPYDLCDEAAEAHFLFPGDRTGEATMDLRAGNTTMPTFRVTVTHREASVDDPDLLAGQSKWRVRRITIHNFLVSAVWHRIDIEDTISLRIDGQHDTVRTWIERESKKIYSLKDAGMEQPDEPYWNSYRHQLEQFVERIRGRRGSGLWVSGEDSLAQARMIDMAYEKSGLPLRRTSAFTIGDIGSRLQHSAFLDCTV